MFFSGNKGAMLFVSKKTNYVLIEYDLISFPVIFEKSDDLGIKALKLTRWLQFTLFH